MQEPYIYDLELEHQHWNQRARAGQWLYTAHLTLAINIRAADSQLSSLTPKLTADSHDTATDPTPDKGDSDKTLVDLAKAYSDSIGLGNT